MIDDSVMYDCMGKEIFVGDTVLIATASRGCAAHLRKGVVTRIGKRISIQECRANYGFSNDLMYGRKCGTAFDESITHNAVYDKDVTRYFKLE